MSLSVEYTENWLVVRSEGQVLRIPDPRYPHLWGSPKVTLDGNIIPSARIWDYMAKCKQKEEEFSYGKLMEEAQRAEIYRQLDTGMIIWTLNPKETDLPIQGNVFARQEKQRLRALTETFGIKIAKVDGDFSPGVVKELHTACSTLGFYPVGCVDERIYYTQKPEAVFKAFGTKDWVRIGVYFKRPSSSSFTLDIE